jgi:hypothetical protein
VFSLERSVYVGVGEYSPMYRLSRFIGAYHPSCATMSSHEKLIFGCWIDWRDYRNVPRETLTSLG